MDTRILGKESNLVCYCVIVRTSAFEGHVERVGVVMRSKKERELYV